jgi:mitochondrial import receptor subunit TOM70
LQWKGDINESLKLLEKAIEVDDKCEFAYETLGTVEVQRGTFKNITKVELKIVKAIVYLQEIWSELFPFLTELSS